MVTLEPGRLYDHVKGGCRRLIVAADPAWMIPAGGLWSERRQIVTYAQTCPGKPTTFVVQCEVWPIDWKEAT